MSDFSKAKDLICRAETGLLEMMQCALAEKRYNDLAELAPVAGALSDILRSIEPDGNARNSPTATTGDALRQMTPAGLFAGSRRLSRSARKPAVKDDEYPRFQRDGDRLVKVGWSKKDGAEYEHRAPRETVLRRSRDS